ncbi:MAG TPA: hypothetical protein VK943_11535 [Arenibaculum sp.]|nr:hypothetical protein [Arenibaculum sp.]
MTADNKLLVETIRKLAGTGPDLSSFAAEDAVETLLENWKEALRDGMDLRALVADVDGVISHLRAFRDRVIERYPSARPEDPLADLAEVQPQTRHDAGTALELASPA